jgi:hypothetical protein
MSKGVIEATLNQIVGIGNLCICGGEPTLALDVLEYIFSYIIDNRIFLNQVSITINETNYSLEFLRLLNYIDDYIKCIDEKAGAIFAISWDKYHIQELERLSMLKVYIENIQRYLKSNYFYGRRKLDDNLKLFKEGNAENLGSHLMIDLKSIDIIVTYAGKNNRFDRRNGLCNIGH